MSTTYVQTTRKSLLIKKENQQRKYGIQIKRNVAAVGVHEDAGC